MTNPKATALIQQYSDENLWKLINDRNRGLTRAFEPLWQLQNETHPEVNKLGEVKFSAAESLMVCSIAVAHSLNERSGKKAQYDLAKKILAQYNNDLDGIFVFHDPEGKFRFSLIYRDFVGNRQKLSNYRRFTYYVSPDLTNKTFLQQVGEGDFSSMEKIKEAFSVEKVTKEFYQEISYWYFWACQQVRFPEAAEKEENGRQVAVIRMITRLIFIWFMREKGLVPPQLFDRNTIKQWLKELDDQSSSYYLAILQNLFFATLNTDIKNRQFRSEIRGLNGHNPDFGNHSKYRHQTLFNEPTQLEEYFLDIPFLNGGLFDCLDNIEQGDYFDGFSDREKLQPLVPNQLFFTTETAADFNAELGTTNQKFKVKGLLEILSTYNFTIDENTADDKDVALDPELLGRVFENLLASFNPETSTTARKATGSYYTPREIVDYMVDESLKGYLRAHLSDLEEIDDKLIKLFSFEAEENPFTTIESKQIVNLIESVRVVDPAVGSGAFPMGILNRLVFLLHKVDRHNEFWKQEQINGANQITDPRLRLETRKRIETYFEKKDDYGRKLFIIQKCIYGVDIQQIAVEIAKLRFFISLLVDEDVDKNKSNWGIEPLPNLDFKIMQGDSLVSEFLGVNFELKNETSVGQVKLDFQDEKSGLIGKFEKIKIEYQNESDKSLKGKLLIEIDDAIIEIFKLIVKQQKESYFNSIESIKRKFSVIPNREEREGVTQKEINKINARYCFDLKDAEKQLREYTGKMKIRPFFPWQLYFAEVFTEKKGFDLIIGNPPYLESRNKSFSEKQKTSYQSACKTRWGEESSYVTKGADLLIYFFELSLHLLNEHGTVTLITQNAWLDTVYGRKFQHFLLRNSKVQRIVDSDYRYFPSGEGPNINTVISFIGNKENKTSKGIDFTRYHVNISNLAFQNTPNKVNDELVASQSKYKYTDKILLNTKWGFLLGSSNQTLHILSQLNNIYCPIEKIKDSQLSYGQGLNLAKEYYVDINKFHQISENDNALIPILTSDDGALFEIHKTSKFLINASKLTQSEKLICKQMGVNYFDPNSTSKSFPILIMPRGIGRHYCSFTNINCFSSSGVDIYDESNNINTEVKMNLWLFFNSSVAWLMREILGRKNLGGGMLKAEAVDLENLPVYFDFQQSTKIASIFNSLKSRQALSSIEEITSPDHQRIDELVFDSLEISRNDRRSIQGELIHIITLRNSKSTT